MKDIFEFNHIDRTLSESDIKTLKDFYSHYHKKYWCFKRSYKRYKLLDETLTLSGGVISGDRNYYWWNNTKPNNTRCDKWRWGARCKYFKNEELQKENGNGANCIYDV